jgi:putative membrane protein
MIRIARYAALSSFFCAMSCGGSEPPPNNPPPPPPPAAAETTMQSTASPPAAPASNPPPPESMPSSTASETPAAEGSSTSASTSSLSDDQILHVLHTANAGEIEQGKLAQQKAKNARVKRFAAMMVKDHSDADKKGTEVAKKAKASPSSNDVSKSLESDAKQMTSSMSSQKGGEFDRSYIEAQVKEHQAVLDLFDKQLIPNAKSADVRALLQTLRPKIEGHLREAQDIQKAL